MDLVGRHLEGAGIEYLRIDGDTLMSRRQRILDEFDKDSRAGVLLRCVSTFYILHLYITAQLKSDRSVVSTIVP